MELVELKATIRNGKGKSLAHALRANNAVPGILYGPKTEPVKVSVLTNDLNKMVLKHGESGVFINLDIEGDSKTSRKVMLKEVQMDTFRLNYLHVDFQEIDMDQKISVFVPVEAVGESKGVKKGGLLQLIRRELEVICLPTDVPESVAIDISNLDVGDVVHVADIDLGESVEIPHEVNFTVVTIVPPTKSESGETEEEVVSELEDADEDVEA